MNDMLTIDGAIAHAREIARESRGNIVAGNNLEPHEAYCNLKCEEYAEEHEQIAEWLEELKAYQRQHIAICEKYGTNTIEDLYNKAIDDFAEKLKSECREHYIDCDPYFGGITDSILYEDDIEEIAEQLKAGGENERSI